jgi:hypothetical protein
MMLGQTENTTAPDSESPRQKSPAELWQVAEDGKFEDMSLEDWLALLKYRNEEKKTFFNNFHSYFPHGFRHSIYSAAPKAEDREELQAERLLYQRILAIAQATAPQILMAKEPITNLRRIEGMSYADLVKNSADYEFFQQTVETYKTLRTKFGYSHYNLAG